MAEREVTAQKLIDAGIKLFGEHGFKATTTRMIADKAGANIGSIAYYFGNKKGLYLAIAQTINKHLTEKLKLDRLRSPANIPDEQISTELIQLLQRLVDLFAADPEAEKWLLFMQREQISPSQAFDQLYENSFQTVHYFLTSLIARLCQLPAEHPQAILQAHLLVGQVSFLLVGRTSLLRRLGSQQSQLDHSTIADIKKIVAQHIENLRSRP